MEEFQRQELNQLYIAKTARNKAKEGVSKLHQKQSNHAPLGFAAFKVYRITHKKRYS